MNVFGERQHPEKFIPKCIISARDGFNIDIHSNKNKTVPGSRHYIHASDVAGAIVFQKLVIKSDKGSLETAEELD